MSETTMREAVLWEFTYDAGVHRLCRVADMADEILRLRDENTAFRAEIDRLRAVEIVMAQHEDTGRTWNGPRCAIPSRYFEVNPAEQEVGRE